MKKEKIYIIGHKYPDTDSICSAIAYSEYLNKKNKMTVASRLDEINEETKFVLSYFKVKQPKSLNKVKGKKIILLDHNEKAQSPDDIARAQILEIIDHHKISFDGPNPIYFLTEPLGSTSTLIAKKYLGDKKVKIKKEIAGILLSGILSDTVVFRSPTTTKEDIEIAKKLAKIAKIKDIESFGIEIKKKKASLKGMSPEKIIYSDFKVFDYKDKKIGIGQVEVCEPKEAQEKKEEILQKLKEINQKENYNLTILMVTDIIKKSSQLWAWGETNYLESAFGKKVENHSLYLKNVLSRKKEIVPPLTKALQK